MSYLFIVDLLAYFLTEGSLDYAIIVPLIMSALGNVGFAVKYVLERGDSTQINAYTQLEKLLNEMKSQLDKKELKGIADEKEYVVIEEKYDALKNKVKKSRLDLLDSLNFIRDIRRWLKVNEVHNEELDKLLLDFEAQVRMVGSYLTLEDIHLSQP